MLLEGTARTCSLPLNVQLEPARMQLGTAGSESTSALPLNTVDGHHQAADRSTHPATSYSMGVSPGAQDQGEFFGALQLHAHLSLTKA